MSHTVLALIEDQPGVLNRIASLCRRRAFNIESLTVGRTADPGMSRMTCVIDADEASADRLVAYLARLVNVVHVEALGSDPGVARDLALVKVAITPRHCTALLRIIDDARARIVDSAEQTMTLEITGEPSGVDAVIARLSSIGIVEMARTGQVAMRRGDSALAACLSSSASSDSVQSRLSGGENGGNLLRR
ncbi:MAG TPA: acetolactate synthase small subunit [Vicinamibacterales bacterium]|nr:acetolactate synthase small subunit [Vicinamibacterales bacterium]